MHFRQEFSYYSLGSTIVKSYGNSAHHPLGAN
jgi:hypothetical protein